MDPGQALIVLIWEVTAVVAAVFISDRKGRKWAGWLLAVVLGWIGVIILAFVPPTREKLVQRERERQQIRDEARS